MTRAFGRAKKGERVVDYTPHGHWNTTTLVGAMTWESAIAPMVLDGPMDTEAFEAYLTHVLIPELPPDAIVVMDNLSAHKPSTVAKLLSEAGVQLRYLPPYSPDLNPIEQMWSKVKSSLKKAKARTEEALFEAIAQALSEVTSSDTQGFFRDSFVCVIS
jgi:transposase